MYKINTHLVDKSLGLILVNKIWFKFQKKSTNAKILLEKIFYFSIFMHCLILKFTAIIQTPTYKYILVICKYIALQLYVWKGCFQLYTVPFICIEVARAIYLVIYTEILLVCVVCVHKCEVPYLLYLLYTQNIHKSPYVHVL